MKEEILRLNAEGVQRSDIAKILQCSRSTVSYHLNPETRAASLTRATNRPHRRLEHKVEAFKSRPTQKLRTATSDFKRGNKRQDRVKPLFSAKDVVTKFGIDTQCYLTGRNINLITDNYHFDHIIPLCLGGNYTLDNLGIACPEANAAKASLALDDFYALCEEILKHREQIR